MGVSVAKLNELRRDWRQSLLSYEQACDERFLEEIENGAETTVAAARARVASQILQQDVSDRAAAVEEAVFEYQAHGDAELTALKLLERLNVGEGNESKAS